MTGSLDFDVRFEPGGWLVGYARDAADRDRQLVLEILIDGILVAAVIANEWSRGLPKASDADARHGFRYRLPDDIVTVGGTVTVKLANSAFTLAEQVLPADVPKLDLAAHLAPGEARWSGGSVIRGWVRPGGTSRVKLVCDGAVSFEHTANRWDHVRLGNTWQAVPAFEIDLPASAIDGRVHVVEIFTEGNEKLLGSPLHVACRERDRSDILPDRSVARKLRDLVQEKLAQRSVGFSSYEAWRREYCRQARVSKAFDAKDFGLVVVASAPEPNGGSISHEGVPHLVIEPASDGRGFDPGSLLQFIDGAGKTASAFVFVRDGTTLAEDALPRIAAALEAHPKAIGAYADFEVVMDTGDRWPMALPAFDYERMLEQSYMTEVLALRVEAVRVALAVGACDLEGLLMSQFDDFRSAVEIAHIPVALAKVPLRRARTGRLGRAAPRHLGRRGIPTRTEHATGSFFESVRIVREPVQTTLVSIIVTTTGPDAVTEEWVSRVLSSVRDLPVEIVVASQGAAAMGLVVPSPERAAGFVPAQRAAAPARQIALAAGAARGDVLCLLDSSVAEFSPGWLQELLGRLADPTVGVAAPLLVRPSGVIFAAGAVLGGPSIVRPAFADRLIGDPGYSGLLEAAHERSAVFGHCLVTRRESFTAAGGVDASAFPRLLYAIDYCARLRSLARRIVVTPHARLTVSDAAVLPHFGPSAEAQCFREFELLRARWIELVADDPYYSPVLALDREPYSGLAAPPGNLEARVQRPPAARPLPDWL